MQVHTDFVMKALIDLFCYQEKAFILLNTWIAGKDLIKHHCLIKNFFYSELYLKDITDKDYTHAQKIFEELELKYLGDYHDLYVQSVHYCSQMYLKTLETSVLKYMNLILLIFCLHRN